MGSRLHGNDGGRRRIPHGGRQRTHIVIPATVCDGAPHTVGRHAPTSLFPRRRESTWGGEPAMGSRLHGNDGGRRRTPHGGRRRTHIVIPRDGGRRRTPHGRRRRTHIVIPATAGIHGGEPAMGSRLHGNDGGRRRTPHGRRRRAHIVIPRDGGRRRTHIVIPAKAGIHGGGRQRWIPVYTGTTVGRRRTPHGGRRRTPHGRAAAHPTSSFPRRRESTAGGDSDGFPSTRERRRATAHPTRRAAAHPTR